MRGLSIICIVGLTPVKAMKLFNAILSEKYNPSFASKRTTAIYFFINQRYFFYSQAFWHWNLCTSSQFWGKNETFSNSFYFHIFLNKTSSLKHHHEKEFHVLCQLNIHFNYFQRHKVRNMLCTICISLNRIHSSERSHYKMLFPLPPAYSRKESQFFW